MVSTRRDYYGVAIFGLMLFLTVKYKSGFTFLDTKTNSIQGVMVDIITEVGKDAGFQVQIEPMQFSTLVPSLTSNKIDIISAAMFATAARKEVMVEEFSTAHRITAAADMAAAGAATDNS